MRVALVVAFLAGCHPHHAGTAASPHRAGPSQRADDDNESRHPCDPKGNDRKPVQPKFLAYLQRELDPAEQELSDTKACSVDVPASSKPIPDDEVLRSECDDLTEKLAGAKRSQCRHACVAHARFSAAAETYRRIIEGLDALATAMSGAHPKALDTCARQYGSAGTGSTSKTDARGGADYWACAGFAPLPASFTIIIQHAHGTLPVLVQADITGSMDGLPRHQWRAEQGDQGCGQSVWDVQQIEPWPEMDR